MNVIGRKIYIAWGPKLTLAIEKLVVPPEHYGLSCHLEDNGFNRPMKIPHVKLFDIFEVMGERMEREVGIPGQPSYNGSEFERYLVDNGNWATKDEFEKMYGKEE